MNEPDKIGKFACPQCELDAMVKKPSGLCVFCDFSNFLTIQGEKIEKTIKTIKEARNA